MTKPSDIFTVQFDAPFEGFNRHRIRGESTYKIYPLSALNDLIAILSSKEEPEVVVRYLVDKNGHFWFAEEGPASRIIPSHAQMIGSSLKKPTCLTAGNLVFSKDYRSIIAIDHKSGDFKPSFNSTQWALVILVANEAALSELGIELNADLLVYELDTAGALIENYTLTKADIIEWAHDIGGEEDLVYFAKQPTAIKTVYYEAVARRFHFSASPTPTLSEYDADVEDNDIDDDDASLSPTNSLSILH